jgi:uncharacterized protein (TIGR02246 family)
MLGEPEMERREHHDDADVRCEPLPEVVPEEQDVDADHDQREHERRDDCRSTDVHGTDTSADRMMGPAKVTLPDDSGRHTVKSGHAGHDDLMTDAETKIRSILDQLQAAVRAKDLDALSELFDDDIVLFGTAAANMNRHETTSYLTQLIAQEGTIRWEWDTVVPLLDESGLLAFAVLGTVGLDDQDGRPEGQRDLFRLTGVAVERDARWRLMHFHGSVPQQA